MRRCWGFVLGGFVIAMTAKTVFAEEVKIVAIGSTLESVLRKKTVNITAEESTLAKEVANRLYEGLKPYFPAAGLAAPQVGINRSVFIYSFDRDPKNLEIVINPQYEPLSKQRVESWEGCLSVMSSNGQWKVAKIPRYESIKVTYTNLEGQIVEKNLDGFAAKVFQHEYDHLQGIINIEHPEAIVKSFDSKDALMEFMTEVKKSDALRYKKPN